MRLCPRRPVSTDREGAQYVQCNIRPCLLICKVMDTVDASSWPMTRARDDFAFDERFAVIRPRLLSLCASLVGLVEAQDVMQDVYLTARGRLAQLRDPAAFEPWLRRIAINLCYDHHRRAARLAVRPLADASLAQPQLTSSEQRDTALRELIERLPPRERTVLVLHYGYGYRLEEIARLLSLSHTNVRSIIARTRKRLHHQLAEGNR